ncbi:hypothetical protein TVAG_330970 [Trichomonas vaginalis G3]|uniref:Bromo domain-containing protein n=1 Tax=Trichomonas vaginalis (strain ATCC PRA-98 / G3) TaxID=412133 RepID=A2GHX8_TRIV3|nr:bromodomain family [Trichomonas vaginalis G3]EAX83240.1 hypothetical protein TVAG_330970 [Trichomonas vaginalis G3]KAI5493438.1 bromodomain family [Trichomonas vaginalis G3]|eukprot:XP_001296170.1 hypothetical protein [Trichomonas vaginalis G3]
MNQVQLDLCQKILNKLKSRPISALFVGSAEYPIEPNMEHPTNLRFIEEKLQRVLYPNCSAFIDETKAFLNSFITHETGDPALRFAAQQLLLDFESELEINNPLKKGLALRLGIVASEFNEYFKNNYSIQNEDKREGQPGSSIFLTQAESISLKELIREIKYLRTPDLILRVTSFIYKRQPEAISLGQETTIEFQLIKPEVLEELKKFVRSLIYSAAIGEINPLGYRPTRKIPVVVDNI